MSRLLYIVLIVLLIGVPSCNNRGKSKENLRENEVSADSTVQRTTIRFVEVEKDMGQVKEGEKVSLVYEVMNTGEADLLLQEVRPSCGCTTPKYEKKPVRPGKKGTIEVSFDTKGRPGKQRKTVMVVTNTEPPNTVLTFTCEVIPAEKD